jgi:c-di-GMP-binding flagellar brake protein YcgR
MAYSGTERRRHPRIAGRFIVSYRILKNSDEADMSQTRNISQGGLLLTTNRKFEPGTVLALEIRLPFDPDPIRVSAKVLESHEVTKNLIYDTRLAFSYMNDRHKKGINSTVDYYLRKGT